MSSYVKTCFWEILLLMALAVPTVLAGGCERHSEPPVQPRSAAPTTAPAPKAERAPQDAAPAPAAEKTSPAQDAAITAKVKSALLADEEVKGLKINVDTRNAEVTLKGALDTDEQVNQAVEVARAVEGVRNVVNRLTVKGEDKAANSNQG